MELKLGGIYKEANIIYYFVIVNIIDDIVYGFVVSKEQSDKAMSNKHVRDIMTFHIILLKKESHFFWKRDRKSVEDAVDGYLGQINDAHLYKLQQHLQGMINDGFLISSNVPFA